MLGVRHGVTDDVLEEHLEDAAGLFVDESRDALDAASARKTTDRWLGDALDVVSQNLAVTLGSPLPLSDGMGGCTEVLAPELQRLIHPSSSNLRCSGRDPRVLWGNLF